MHILSEMQTEFSGKRAPNKFVKQIITSAMCLCNSGTRSHLTEGNTEIKAYGDPMIWDHPRLHS